MDNDKHNCWILSLLGVVMIVGIGLYLTYNSRGNFRFAFNIRAPRIPAIIIVSFATTIATITFQTMTKNNILSPSIIGLDGLYVLIQTASLFFLGIHNPFVQNQQLNFILSTSLMLVASFGLFYIFFKKYPGKLFLLLMTGLIFGILMRNLTIFLQVLINPNEFQSILVRTLTSFNEIHSALLVITGCIIFPIVVYLFKHAHVLNVLHLGENYATNLGISIQREYFTLFILVSILTAVSTALVGPITFLGFLGANLSYRLFKTYHHKLLFLGGGLLTSILLIYGQLTLEHVLPQRTNISVIIELCGGLYFLYIIIKERKQHL